MKQTMPTMKDYALQPAEFIEGYANAAGISMEAATEATNLRVVNACARAWNVSSEDAWKRLVKEDMKKKTKAPEWKLPGEVKELLNLIDGAAGLITDIITTVFIIAVILACLRWLLGIGA